MSRSVQALVAAACVAVLAFVGYYFFSEWQSARLAEERAADARHDALINEIQRRYGIRP